nr:hypothetical protein [Paenibacillus odorifer]
MGQSTIVRYITMPNLQIGVLYGQVLTILLYRKMLSNFAVAQVTVLLRFVEGLD